MPTIINPLPYVFVNGTTIDATQMDADLGQIVSNVNVLGTTAGAALVGATAATNNSGATVQAQLNNVGGVAGATNVGYTPPGTGAVPTTVGAELAHFVWVTDFAANGVSGALVDPTGVLDSTLGIQAAINYIQSIGGGGVLFPQGKFLAGPLKATHSSVKMIGQGSGSYHYPPVPAVDAATQILYNGVAGGTMMTFDPSYPTRSNWMADCKFDGIFLVGQGVAGVGLQINSCRNGYFRAIGNECTINICQMGVTLPGYPLSDTADCQENYVEVQGNQSQGIAPNGGLLFMNGQSFSFTGYAVGSVLTVTAISPGNYIPTNAWLLVGTGVTSTSSGVTITSYGTGNGASPGTYNLSSTPSTLYSSGAPGVYGIANADVSSNIIGYVDGGTYNGNAVVWGNTDNNLMHSGRVYVQGPGTAGFGGTGRPMVFLAGGYNQAARQNYITHFSGAATNAYSQVVAQGTESGTANTFGNWITYLDPLEGGNWQPTCGTVAQLFWNASNGATVSVRATTRNATSQSFSSGTPAAIYWDNLANNYDLLNNMTSNTTFTAPKYGVYDVSVTLTCQTSVVTGDRYECDIVVVGTFSNSEATQWWIYAGSTINSFVARAKMRMAYGDTLQVQISRQQGSGSFAPSTTDSNNRMEINYIGQSA